MDKLPAVPRNRRFDGIKGIITLVDGTLLPALPKILEAMWCDEEHKTFKLHTHLGWLKGAPTRMDLTAANTGESRVLKAALQPDRVYVMDRGYTDFAPFQRIIETAASFLCRAPGGHGFCGDRGTRRVCQGASSQDPS